MLMGNKKVKIFGVPLDLGANKLGVDMGPDAIRYAGLLEALAFNNIEYSDYGNLRIADRRGREVKETIKEVSEELAELVYEAMKDDFIPIILGGDHSASIGSIAGASKRADKLGVIWLDFHPDANTPETSPSGNIHGMPVAISLGYGYPELVNCAGFKPKILPENICIIGAKDIDEEEKTLLDDLGVKMYTLLDIDRLGIYKVLENVLSRLQNCDCIHVSFDVDVLDPLIAPGTGILSKGGLSYREISYVMSTLGKENIVRSMDVIEINPLLDQRNATAELAIELVLSCLGGSYGDYERHYLKER
jgi:arginase